MRILICNPNVHLAEEIAEYCRGCSWEADIATDPSSIYRSLSQISYDVALYRVSSLEDFAQIRYINENYSQINVIISMEHDLGNAIETVRNGFYQSIPCPYHLKDLGQFINSFGFATKAKQHAESY